MIFMKKIERWGRSCLTFGSRHKLGLVIILSLVILVWSVFYGVVYGRLWLHFPARLKAVVAINRLGVNAHNNPVCHEPCFYERQLYKKVIANNLSTASIGNRVQQLILAEDNNLNFRLELLDILSFRNDLALPDYLSEYLTGGKDLRVKEKIRELLEVDEVAADELLNRLAAATSTTEKVDILHRLSAESNSSLAESYLDLIITDPELKVKNGALSALSNLLPSSDYVTADFLLQFKQLIFTPGLDQYLRKEIILLLGDYLAIQEKPVAEILLAAYSDETVIDKFSRLFAADTLNRLSANNYSKPEISASEWQAYRDHNSLWGNE
jgi:hypothetical protein